MSTQLNTNKDGPFDLIANYCYQINEKSSIEDVYQLMRIRQAGEETNNPIFYTKGAKNQKIIKELFSRLKGMITDLGSHPLHKLLITKIPDGETTKFPSADLIGYVASLNRVKISELDNNGDVPLQLAVNGGHAEAVDTLLQMTNKEVRAQVATSSLLSSGANITENCYQTLSTLIKHGANIGASNNRLLFEVITFSNLPMLEACLKLGANPNESNQVGLINPLTTAMRRFESPRPQSVECAIKLLAAGADLYAASFGFEMNYTQETANAFLDFLLNAMLLKRDERIKIIFFSAISMGEARLLDTATEVIIKLIEHCPDMNQHIRENDKTLVSFWNYNPARNPERQRNLDRIEEALRNRLEKTSKESWEAALKDIDMPPTTYKSPD